jgi:hypothetical protein
VRSVGRSDLRACSRIVESTRFDARPRGLLGTTIVLMDAEREVAVLRTSAWRSRAELRMGGTSFAFLREPRWGRFLLRAGDLQLASAEKPSIWRSRFEVRLGDVSLELRRAGFIRSDYVLIEAGAEVGRIRQTGLLRLGGSLELPADWPVPLQAFTFWLALIMWKRERAAAFG